jgi:flagellar protein FlaG
MSADTFTTAIFLITAVIAAAVLINAIFPVVYQMAGTFSSATHTSDVRLRTDFVIITTFANGNPTLSGQIWMKNIGSQPISTSEIQSSDVFFGPVGNFKHLSLQKGQWSYQLSDLNGNGYWDPGETLEIDASTSDTVPTGGLLYFQFVLPNGVWRSNQFTSS